MKISKVKAIGLSAVAVLIGIQFVPVRRDNPPVTGDVAAPKDAQAVLRKSCYDCHSHETRWPWYSHVAPVSWLIASDVHGGRDHLDFSTWNDYPDGQRDYYRKQSYKRVSQGDMPPLVYLLIHRNAKLTAGDKDILRLWQ